MIYLLHFDPTVGGKRHYLGWTSENRLDRRLREHALGNGASLTRRAFKQGATVYLARVFPDLDHNDERRLKTASHFRNYCPLCCPLLATLAQPAHVIDPKRPDQPPQRAIWDWRRPAGAT